MEHKGSITVFNGPDPCAIGWVMGMTSKKTGQESWTEEGGFIETKSDIHLEYMRHTINLATNKLVKYCNIFLVKWIVNLDVGNK